jgi:hypothetical protein
MPASAQSVQPPYDTDYVIVDLGPAPGVPSFYGGLTFKIDDPNTLLIGGEANLGSGMLYAITVVRGADNHITGFAGDATVFAEAAFNDGGVTYGPDNVLFLARYGSTLNEIGQTKFGSSTTDKIVPLSPLGVVPSPGGLNFVPPGFPGAGNLKGVSWPGGEWYTLELSPDGAGTFDVVAASQATTIAGGPEGFIYVPPGSPQFTDFTNLLVSEFSDGNIAVYDIDSNGDPVPATRDVMVSGLLKAEGAALDPLTGDFFFSTFGSDQGDRVYAVTGFAPPTEICDGIDNDGDGEVDEDFDVGDPCTAGEGPCAVEGNMVCTEDGQATVCDAEPGTGALDDVTCDGVDDDCDGVVDEDYVGHPTTCGIGACVATGMTECLDGSVEDSCTPGDPTDEDCINGVDDDCDGLTDGEDLEDCGAGDCVDYDGDGYGYPGDATCPGGPAADCDDADPSVNPGAVDLPGNFIDENCDGVLACDPCGRWRNHGMFVRCVAHAVNDLVRDWLLERNAGTELIRSAAQSDVGKRGYTAPGCAAASGSTPVQSRRAQPSQ